MKNKLKNIKFFLLLFIGVSAYSQKTDNLTPHSIIADSEQYQQLKKSGKLGEIISSGTIIINPNNTTITTSNNKAVGSDNPPSQIYSSSCWGYTPPNPSATPTLINVDDQGFGPIALPFNFCFYGTSYNACYINSNGNVTFTQAFTTYTATTFPSNTIPPMLAPFWGDVDTRGGFGVCYYEVLSNAAIFHWEGVGYFNTHGDKLNTFQLIISDFTSPLLQPGNNVGFFYDNMDWTTGDASSGVNGYGGTPATVGVNEGNGIDYIQIGRFDGAGNFYDGPFNQNDSVDWLDNKTFMFDVCNSVNLPPIVAGIDFCDTLRLCVGDTLPVNVTFLAPESNQTTWATVDTSLASGFHVISNTSGTGSSCQINSQLIGTNLNIGVNIVTFTSYDNGVPADTIVLDYIILVDSISMYPVITGDTSYCQGSNVILDGGAGFDSYSWSNGDTSQTITVSQGSYTLQAYLGGCNVTTQPFTVSEISLPSVSISGDTLFCSGDSVLLSATQGFDTYLWTSNPNDTLDSVYVTQGVFSVTVSDSNGCQGISNSISVIDFSSTVNIVGDTSYCLGDSVLLNAGSTYDSYLWSNGDTSQTTYVTQGNISLTVSAYGCLAVDSHLVSLINVPIPVITGDSVYCQGDNILLDAGGGYTSYSWSLTPPQFTQTVNVIQGTYTVTGTQNGCDATSLPFTVTENPLPIPVISGNLHYCSNDSNGTTLATSNSYAQYTWSNGDTNSTIIATTTSPLYLVTVVDSNGCIGVSDSVIITQSSPNNNITGITDFCPGETIPISADNGYNTYLWSNGSNSQLINAGTGTYIVMVADSFGCTDVDSITLFANPSPVASFSISPSQHGSTDDPIVFTDMSSIINGSIINWNWIFDFNNIGSVTPTFGFIQGTYTVIYDNQGTYGIWLEVTSDKGCKDTVLIDYLIVDDIIAPNIFTPNNDGYNDKLVFKNLEYQPSNHITIMSRWGKTIFETDNYKNDWNGDNHSSGTYFYILSIPDIEPIKGSFTILR